ncbi:hypothetical protein H257_08920 [Aphanomyces astaci]|uniref:Uncharacterized protein n=1 Tax=Aphanomyces astaci TaxID=112090 RepID=W4GDG4_APHAT|nr:hypothetical protein H257_08920 [Aphanomyces astaci]ETV77003.1 hypothetical protein H257_08920 [Aphanomyces astaci]|eukprot:XP_009833309.1 hypothetical protein H257_08920 [Aphanomyces astaci]
MVAKLPCTTYFMCPPLSVDEKHHLKSLAIDTAMRIVQLAQMMDAESSCTSRRLQKEVDGALRIYKGTRVHEHNSFQITSLYCGHVTIETTLDEAIYLFRTDGTNARKTLHQLRFGHRQHNANNTTTL